MTKLLEALSDLLSSLEALLHNLFPDVEENPQNLPMNESHSDKLYTAAFKAIGTDVSPDDLANDSLGCMESVSNLLRKTFPDLRFPMILSTREAYQYFSKSPSFRETNTPKGGVIILSVTGAGNGKVKNGHVGICGKNLAPDKTLHVMSNNSFTGKWDVAYTIRKWEKYFGDLGGMETHYFERV